MILGAPGRAPGRATLGEGQQQVGAGGVEQRVLGDRAGGDQADHGAADRRLAGAGLRVLHLLDHGDAEAAADQPAEIELGGVDGHAAHRDGGAGVLAATGQRDVEGGGGGFGVGEEELVEVAHAEKEQRVGVVRLDGEPLRHHGGGAGGVRDGGHGVGLAQRALGAKRWLEAGFGDGSSHPSQRNELDH